jgi:hypothetical protein
MYCVCVCLKEIKMYLHYLMWSIKMYKCTCIVFTKLHLHIQTYTFTLSQCFYQKPYTNNTSLNL